MKITYFNDGCKKVCVVMVYGGLYIDSSAVHFSIGDVRRSIETKYIIKIEPIEQAK